MIYKSSIQFKVSDTLSYINALYVLSDYYRFIEFSDFYIDNIYLLRNYKNISTNVFKFSSKRLSEVAVIKDKYYNSIDMSKISTRIDITDSSRANIIYKLQSKYGDYTESDEEIIISSENYYDIAYALALLRKFDKDYNYRVYSLLQLNLTYVFEYLLNMYKSYDKEKVLNIFLTGIQLNDNILKGDNINSYYVNTKLFNENLPPSEYENVLSATSTKNEISNYIFQSRDKDNMVKMNENGQQSYTTDKYQNKKPNYSISRQQNENDNEQSYSISRQPKHVNEHQNNKKLRNEFCMNDTILNEPDTTTNDIRIKNNLINFDIMIYTDKHMIHVINPNLSFPLWAFYLKQKNRSLLNLGRIMFYKPHKIIYNNHKHFENGELRITIFNKDQIDENYANLVNYISYLFPVDKVNLLLNIKQIPETNLFFSYQGAMTLVGFV